MVVRRSGCLSQALLWIWSNLSQGTCWRHHRHHQWSLVFTNTFDNPVDFPKKEQCPQYQAENLVGWHLSIGLNTMLQASACNILRQTLGWPMSYQTWYRISCLVISHYRSCNNARIMLVETVYAEQVLINSSWCFFAHFLSIPWLGESSQHPNFPGFVII